jgi:hypothetical protein
MDFKDLDFGIKNTQEFSMEEGSPLEGLLDGNTKLEKIDPEQEAKKKKEAKEAAAKQKAKAKATKAPEEEEEEEEETPETPVHKPLDLLKEFEGDETDEDEEEENQENQEGDAEESAEEVSEFEEISKELYNLGIFQEDEEGNRVVAKTGEELAEMFQEANRRGASEWLHNFLSSRGEDRMEIFDAIFVKGVDPREYFDTYNTLLDFSELDASQEEDQKQIFREYYKRQNWSPEQIEKKLQRELDAGYLSEDAPEMLDKILDQDKKELEFKALRKEAEEKKKKEADLQYRTAVQENLTQAIKARELQGFPITEKQASQIASFLLQPAYKSPSGEILSEYDAMILESRKPENISKRILQAYLHLNNYDLSKLEKRAITKESSKVFGGIKRKSIASKSQKPGETTSWDL